MGLPVAYEKQTACVNGGNFNFKRMANGTLFSLSDAEFDESSWCAAPRPRSQTTRNILAYAAAAHSPATVEVARFTCLLN